MPQTAFTTFHALHFANTPLLLPNAWDAASARLLALDGAPALATSSAALAWSLGYADGGALPRAELMAAIRRIARVIDVPLSVDLEDGYSNQADEVADLVCEAQACGACGINLEDGAASPELLAQKIAAIRQALGATPLFINARTDVYLAGLAQGDAAIAMSIARLQAYQAAGADGGFIPGLAHAAALAPIASAVNMPLNLMMLPDMDSVNDLFAAGARRFTLGPALFQSVYGYGRAQVRRFMQQQDASDMFGHDLPYPWLNAAFQA